MNLYEMFEQSKPATLIDALRDFLPLVVEHLQLSALPKIKLKREVEGKHLPTFGSFNNEDSIIELNIANRHPNDILRTLAHELVHHKQNTLNQLDSNSWETGSDAENEANAEAGVIMRLFNSEYPQYLKLKPIMVESAVSGHDEPEDQPGMQSTPSDPIPFPKGTTLVNVSDVYDWYKLGMAVSDLDDADPRTFNKGVPHTVFAFGSEEEEHKMIPLLKRLGFSLHDIDSPGDYAKAIRADEAIKFLESYVTENFADGKKPGRKGLAKRSGVNCKQSVTKLRSIAKNSTGERQRMAHWCANMKAGRKG